MSNSYSLKVSICNTLKVLLFFGVYGIVDVSLFVKKNLV